MQKMQSKEKMHSLEAEAVSHMSSNLAKRNKKGEVSEGASEKEERNNEGMLLLFGIIF